MLSAHWVDQPITLGATRRVPLVYDFYGFPAKYYETTYPAPPAPALAARVRDLLRAEPVAQDPERGLDHGAYVPLVAMYPAADVPVLQVSLPSLDPTALFSLGRALAPLRREGVLIVGSGFLTHNLRTVDFRPDAPTPAWASEFDAWAGDVLARRDVDALLDYRARAPGVRQALPTHEHFVPVIVVDGRRDRRHGGDGALPDHGLRLRHRRRAGPCSSAERVSVRSRAWHRSARRCCAGRSGDGLRPPAALPRRRRSRVDRAARAPHFRLRTDDDPAAGRAMLADLEQLRAALLTVFGATPDVDIGRLPVVVVDRGWTDFAPRAGRRLLHARPVSAADRHGGGRRARSGSDVIKHELVHYLSAQDRGPTQPPWFAEGLATYYQTIEYDADAGRVTVGRPPTELAARRARASAPANIEQHVRREDDRRATTRRASTPPPGSPFTT